MYLRVPEEVVERELLGARRVRCSCLRRVEEVRDRSCGASASGVAPVGTGVGGRMGERGRWSVRGGFGMAVIEICGPTDAMIVLIAAGLVVVGVGAVESGGGERRSWSAWRSVMISKVGDSSWRSCWSDMLVCIGLEFACTRGMLKNEVMADVIFRDMASGVSVVGRKEKWAANVARLTWDENVRLRSRRDPPEEMVYEREVRLIGGRLLCCRCRQVGQVDVCTGVMRMKRLVGKRRDCVKMGAIGIFVLRQL